MTKLVTDHPHLFETGGENYHVDFTAWDYQRGHESDPWRTRPDPSWIGAPSFGRGHTPYDNSRGWFRDEDDFPGPRVMREAERWLERRSADRRTASCCSSTSSIRTSRSTRPSRTRRCTTTTGPSPRTSSGRRTPSARSRKGVITEREGRQVRAQYGAKLTMIDAWFGRVLDALDATGRLDDTAVIVCTDHGHYLGEKDIWGKPGCPIYEPLGHMPLLIAWPGVDARNAATR